jgi:hypothetical protein
LDWGGGGGASRDRLSFSRIFRLRGGSGMVWINASLVPMPQCNSYRFSAYFPLPFRLGKDNRNRNRTDKQAAGFLILRVALPFFRGSYAVVGTVVQIVSFH